MEGSLFGESFAYWATVQQTLREHNIHHVHQLRLMLDERDALAKRVAELEAAASSRARETFAAAYSDGARFVREHDDALARIAELEAQLEDSRAERETALFDLAHADAERGRLRRHVDTAGDGMNLCALLDLYHDRATAAEKRVAELEEEVKRQGRAWAISLDAALARVAELERSLARIHTIADENGGPHPVQSVEDSLTCIEAELHRRHVENARLEKRVAELESALEATRGEVVLALEDMHEAQWVAPPGFAAEGHMRNARGILERALKGGG